MYEVFFVGDFKNETGPAIANKAMREGLKSAKGILYSEANNKIIRIIELIVKVLVSKNIVFCSASQLNIYGIKLAKFLNRKTFYVMHGYESFEYKINNCNIEDDKYVSIRNYEKFVFEKIDKIFCVSKSFMNFMKKREWEFEKKFDYNYNGLNIDELKHYTTNYNKRDRNQIISVGGGRKQKNNLYVCKAIDNLNKKYNCNLKYTVIGAAYTDKKKICEYDFVTYYESLPHDEVIRLLNESSIYVQNSHLETFGIAVLEGLFSGCSCLISNTVGAKDIFERIDENDIIYNPNDIDEISVKIMILLVNNNNLRLITNINEKILFPNVSASELLKKIRLS